MEKESPSSSTTVSLTRRNFLKALFGGSITVAGGLALLKYFPRIEPQTETVIASVNHYSADIQNAILQGIKELGISSTEITGKRVLLKPNLVEPHRGKSHINTNPFVIRAVVEVFFHLGASKVIVAEGAGHRRDSFLVLEESGLADVLYEDRIPFIDLNTGPVVRVKNLSRITKLGDLFLPKEVVRADFLVSLAKMKTHHWAGVTLSMKNLFGLMPGIIYGWPKNVLHWADINKAIFDINATVKPDLAIVDGIVGMEGDGPIMGTPIQANVLVMGRNPAAVDATCARIMGINPKKIPYLRRASGRIGTVRESNINQRGESIVSVRKDFQLLDFIPAHKGIRL